MKTIIIPTDFSDNSIKAVEFAFNFFNQVGNRIILCNVYDIPVGGTSRLFTLLEQIKVQVDKDMDELLTNLGEKYPNTSFSIESKVLQGDFEDQVKSLSSQAEADFVIIGTKGATGMKEVLIGSNASKLLKAIQLPVFSIPANYEKSSIKNLIFSYDGKEIKQNDIQLMREFAKENQLPVKVLRVKTDEQAPSQSKSEIENIFENLSISFHEIEANNFQDGLKEEVVNQKDILVLYRRKKSFWEKLINDSDSQKVVRHFQLPILVLPEVD